MRFQSILSRVMAYAMAMMLAHPGVGAEPDPAVTVYGELNPNAPAELATFAFLIGTWSGSARTRDAKGEYSDYQFQWIGRYVLDGMAIADEMRIPGGAVQGMSFRSYDTASNSWVIEYLNFNRSFVRRQVNAQSGDVRREAGNVTILQPGPDGTLMREVYTVLDAGHFTYSMDQSADAGQSWDVGLVTMDMQREEGP